MKTKLLALAVVGALSTSSAWAAPYSFGGTGPQDANGGPVNTVGDVLDDIATDNVSDVRFDDYMADYADSYWSTTGTGQTAATMIIELAGFKNTNTFGIYQKGNAGNMIELFDGAASPGGVGSGATVNITLEANGDVWINNTTLAGNIGTAGVFGYYLDSSAAGGGGVWYSDSSLNSDGVDHMAAYRGVGENVQLDGFNPGSWTTEEYVLAFEDLDCTAGCDGDYTDFMVMVESVEPVSSPGSLALMGLGLGLIGAAARRRSAKRA